MPTPAQEPDESASEQSAGSDHADAVFRALQGCDALQLRRPFDEMTVLRDAMELLDGRQRLAARVRMRLAELLVQEP